MTRLPDGSGFFVLDIGPREQHDLISRIKYHKKGYARRWLYAWRNFRTGVEGGLSLARAIRWAVSVSFLVILSTTFGQNVYVTNSTAHPVPVNVVSGGGGGGGAATIADGADVTEGAIADAAATQGSTGTVSAKLRTATAQLNTLNTTVATAANQSTANTSLATIATNTGNIQSATATTVKSTALEASHVLKASAGTLVRIDVFNSKTSAQYILVMDSATVPADGAVTLLLPPIPIPANGYATLQFTKPITAVNGVAVSNSSTGTFTKTIGSADCVFTAQVQ